jgi:hypothetical protein
MKVQLDPKSKKIVSEGGNLDSNKVEISKKGKKKTKSIEITSDEVVKKETKTKPVKKK